MIRLLFLCLLLLRPAVSKEEDGSGLGDDDDEGDVLEEDVSTDLGQESSSVDTTRGEKDKSGEGDQITLIVIVVAATVVALSVSAVAITMLVRRHMLKRQQGIYSVPTEQDQKAAV